MDFEYLNPDGTRSGRGFNVVNPLGEGLLASANGTRFDAAPSSDHAPLQVTLRLVDGSQPEDWNPSHGDRPCRWNGHDGSHPLNGCPDTCAAMEPDPNAEGWREHR